MSFHDISLYTEYAVDIAKSLRIKERERMPFYYQSPQIGYRFHLVNWIRNAGEEMKLTNTTVHLAVYLLDIFMDGHQIIPERLNLVTVVCLTLAAKMEELELNVPKTTELNTRIKTKYGASDFIRLEFMVLQFVKWNLIHPTAVHFMEYFVAVATTPADAKNAYLFESYKQLQHCALQYTKDFLDKSLMDIQMHHFPPSLVAASCIAAARRVLCLTPQWPLKLALVTEYQLCDLQPCIKLLIRETDNVRKRKIVESPDHGYETGGSLSSTPSRRNYKRGNYKKAR